MQVFPKGSPLVDDVSEEILNIIEGDEMEEIERKWFGDLKACSINAKTVNSANLTFQSFSGLFIITGAASTCALLIFLALFLSKNWKELKNLDSDKTAWQRLMSLWEYYNKKDLNSHSSKRNKVSVNANDRNYDSHQESPGVETQTVSGHCDAKTNEPEEISCSELTSPNSDAVLAVVPQ